MSCAPKYDLQITDGLGVSHGLVCDWNKGGVGMKTDSPPDITRGWNVSTKGDYGVRDVNDYWRIIQSDWSEGAGQTTFDRDADSASSFLSSENIDTSMVGAFSLGPALNSVPSTAFLPAICAGLADGLGNPYVFVGWNASPWLRYSTDGVTWSPISGSLGAAPTSICTDGEYMYAAAGPVYRGTTAGWTTYSADGTNNGFSHVAVASGTLYAAKNGPLGAQIGYFDTSPAPKWTALSPAVARSINAAGSTFGMVANGNYVYWGVTNGMVTTVYKSMFVGNSQDVLTAVATMPTGFVGSSLYAYLGNVYIGGHFDGAEPKTGQGAIYAVVNDSPVLLTNIGDRKSDNRILAMSGYERNLFFVSNGRVWRWDLVHGGYSHWAGNSDTPLGTADPNSTTIWQLTSVVWDMVASPTAVGATETTGNMTLTYAGGTLTVRSTATYQNATISQGTSIFNDDGSTVQLSITPGGLKYQSEFTNPYMALGVRDEKRYYFIYLKPNKPQVFNNGRLTLNSYDVTVHDAEGNQIALLGTFNGDQAHDFRFSMLGNSVSSWCDVTQLPSFTPPLVTGPSGSNSISLDFFGGPNATVNAYNFVVQDLRWYAQAAHAVGSFTPPSGLGMACARDEVWVSCSALALYKTDKNTPAPSGYLVSSKSSGNMPTVDKLFTAVHVQTDTVVTGLSVTAFVDGNPIQLTESEATVGTKAHVFPLYAQGRVVQAEIDLANVNGSPIVTETSFLFLPMPSTPRNHTYAVRCWDNAESRVEGQEWDEDAGTVADWLEETAHSVVTVSRPGREDFVAILDALEYLEAPPSGKANGREGLYSLTLRELR